MPGMIQGGWEYVDAAYTITANVIIFYAFALYWRLRAARRIDR